MQRLVTVQPTAIEKPTPEDNKFAKFDKVTDYQTVNTYEIGGSDPEFLDFQFTHKPLVAVVEVCAVQPPDHALRCPASEAGVRPDIGQERLRDPVA